MRLVSGVLIGLFATTANADELTDEPPITQPLPPPPPQPPQPTPPAPTNAGERPPPAHDADEPPHGRPGAPPAPRPPPPRFVSVPRSETPPLSQPRIAGQVAVGALIALPSGLFGALIGGASCTREGDLACLGHAAVGGYVGAVFGVGLGVYAVGSYGDQRGSFGATMGGALIGSAASGLLLYLGSKIVDGDEEENAVSVAVALVAPPFIGAIVGFNLTRGYEPKRVRVGSLLMFDGARVDVGVPLVVGDTLSLASGAF